jgi:hypothetical protein
MSIDFQEDSQTGPTLSLILALSTVVFQLLQYYGISTKPAGFGTPF